VTLGGDVNRPNANGTGRWFTTVFSYWNPAAVLA
jgi:hypothetical protein